MNFVILFKCVLYCVSCLFDFKRGWPALAEATFRDHNPSSCVVVLRRRRRRHKKISVTFFSGITQANMENCIVYRSFESAACSLPVWCDFEYCGHRQICSQDNFCHIFLGNHRGQLSDIWHRTSVWRTVSCNAFLNLRHVHFLFDATLNI